MQTIPDDGQRNFESPGDNFGKFIHLKPDTYQEIKLNFNYKICLFYLIKHA